MSYILDALRKSDQQRRLGAVPTLAGAPLAAMAPQRPALLSLGLSALVLLMAVATAIAWLRPSPAAPAAIAAVEMKPPAVLPRPVLPVLVPAAPAVAPVPASAASLSARTLPAPPRAATRRPAVVAARPVEGSTAAQGHAADDASGALAQQQPVMNPDMPLAIRKTLPAISVAVHAYSNTPQDRLVSINGRMLREGDRLAPDLRLEQITPDGMIFSYLGYRFRRAAQ